MYLCRGQKTINVNLHLPRSTRSLRKMAWWCPRTTCLLMEGTEHFCYIWQSTWQALHVSSSKKSFWWRQGVPEIVSLPHKYSVIKNVCFCIRLNTTSLEGFPQKLRERKRHPPALVQKIQCGGEDSVVEAARGAFLCCLVWDKQFQSGYSYLSGVFLRWVVWWEVPF